MIKAEGEMVLEHLTDHQEGAMVPERAGLGASAGAGLGASAGAGLGASAGAGMESPEAAGQKTEKAKDVNVALWLCLFSLGFIFEFIGRFIGFENNPLGIWHESAPVLTTIVAGMIIFIGAFRVASSWTAKNIGRFRSSLLLVMLGVIMLAGSFVSKNIVEVIFL